MNYPSMNAPRTSTPDNKNADVPIVEPPLLEVSDLQVDFATGQGPLYAVRGTSFDLREGEILGVVGESGSGKSVTAHSLLRLLPGNGAIGGGDIRFRGESILGFTGRELAGWRGREIGIIFQEPGRSFDPIYSIGKTMAETLRAHEPHLSDAEIRARSIALLKEVHIPSPEERLSNFPHQFSGGLLQRIMIALALAGDPDILIADEPTTALDVTIQAQIIDLLLELRNRRNLAILFITHNLALIGQIADRIIVMYAGLVMEKGETRTVLDAPRHPYTRALLSSILNLGDHYTTTTIRTVAGSVPDPRRPEPGCPLAPRCPLADDRCRERIPDMVTEGTTHRCRVTGVKGADFFPEARPHASG